MRTFRKIDSGIVVGLSLKVLFSFFSKHPDFTEIYPPTVTPDYFIVRNPFDRALDLWADKCQSRVALDGPEQVCQMLLVETLNLRQRSDLEFVSFKRFCSVLPFVFNQEEHFWPQWSGFTGIGRQDANKIVRVIQIENGLRRLGKEICVDFSQKQNVASKDHWTLSYDSESLYTVKELYREDFITFGY